LLSMLAGFKWSVWRHTHTHAISDLKMESRAKEGYTGTTGA